MTQQELEKYLWGAATALRGTIDAGDYKQYIFPLLFFKRISDVYDEEYENALAESDGDIAYAAFAENDGRAEVYVVESILTGEECRAGKQLFLVADNGLRHARCAGASRFL